MKIEKEQLEKVSFWSSVIAVIAVVTTAATGINLYAVAGIAGATSIITFVANKVIK